MCGSETHVLPYILITTAPIVDSTKYTLSKCVYRLTRAMIEKVLKKINF